MIEFIDPNRNKVVAQWSEMSRKAYYIHGTVSKKNRWNMFPTTVQQLNRIAFGIGVDKNDTEGISYVGSDGFKKACCDFSFQWGNNGIIASGNNWFLNSVEDRRVASEKLIDHISKNIGKCEEVVLIGHSHGGNVAIQAADKIFTKISTIKRVFVLTIGTPVFNRQYIISYINNKNLTTISEEIYENIPYLGKDYIVPAMKLGRKISGPLGVYLYINCENPATWKNKDKISHTSLWNKKDHVDNIAWILEKCKYVHYPYRAMTWDNSSRFTNPTTVNVEFDFDPEETRSDCERQIKPFAEWLSKLDYLRKCLIDLRLEGYIIPKMPELFTYQEYTSRHEKMSLSGSMEKVYVNQPDALQIKVTEPKPTVKWKNPSTKLREEKNNLRELFKDCNDFYQFMEGIDHAKKSVKSPNIQDIIDIYQQKYPEIEAIEKKKQELYSETEFREIAMTIYLLDNSSFQEHGFDLYNPNVIEEAINDGRIKPFPMATTNDIID